MKEENQEVTKKTTIGEVVEKYGYDAAKIMMKYGLHCVGCHMAAWETIEQGAFGHGIGEKELNEMIKKLNALVEKSEAKQ